MNQGQTQASQGQTQGLPLPKATKWGDVGTDLVSALARDVRPNTFVMAFNQGQTQGLPLRQATKLGDVGADLVSALARDVYPYEAQNTKHSKRTISPMTRLFQRKSIRLKGYDYSKAGLYFLTICVQDRLELFATIADQKLSLSPSGQMIDRMWCAMPNRLANIHLHAYVVMPNHFHAIIEIDSITNDTSLATVVQQFKSLTTLEYIKGIAQHNWIGFNKRLWQRNYHDHIIRDDKSYERITQYIEHNPVVWEADVYFSA